MDLSSKTCRLCMQMHLHNRNLFRVDCSLDFEDNLVDVIRKTTCVQIEPNDGLPQNVCTFCKQELLRLAKFTMMIEKSDLAFRQTFNFIKIKSEFSEEFTTTDENCKREIFCHVEEQEADIKPAQDIKMEIIYDEEGSNTFEVSKEPKEETHLRDEAWQTDELLNSNNSDTDLKREKINYTSFHSSENENYTNLSCTEGPNESENIALPIPQTEQVVHILNKEISSGLACKCGKTFARNKYIQRHLKRHNSTKTQLCSTCGKYFYATDIKRHIATHAKNKPFACLHCGMGFYHLNQLMRHQFKEHLEKNNKTDHDASKKT